MPMNWGGPAKPEFISGTVDAMDEKVSTYGGKDKTQIQMVLVDAHQRDTDGSEKEFDSRTLYIATGGKPGNAFYGSCKSVMGLEPKTKLTDTMFIGAHVEIAVDYEAFVLPDGNTAEMTLYKLVALSRPGENVSDEKVLERLVGLTPVDAIKIRAEFKSTPFFKILGSKKDVLAYFGNRITLVDGKYTKSA